MTQRRVSVIRLDRSCRRTSSTRSTVLALTVVALLSAGCSSGPTAGAPNPGSSQPLSTTPTRVATVPRLPEGVIASVKLPLGTAPFAATAGFGSLWVVGHHGSYVSRVDPRTDKVVARIRVDYSCFSPFITATRVVIGTCAPYGPTGLPSGNVAIDPRTNRVVGAVGDVLMGDPPARNLQPSAFGVQSTIGYANGVPWTFGAGVIQRLDPRTFRPNGATYHVDANPHHVTDADEVATYADGSWWVVNFGDEDGLWGGQVVKVDPRTGHETHLDVPDPGDMPDVETFGRAIWLKSMSNDRLVRMDPQTGQLTTFHLPGWAPLNSFWPQVIGIARGDLWIRIRSGRVVRFDPRKKRVVATYPADPQAGGGEETVAFGSLWVMNYNDDTVWRVRLRS